MTQDVEDATKQEQVATDPYEITEEIKRNSQDDISLQSTFIKIGLNEYDAGGLGIVEERTFRGAWSDPDGTRISVNMELAKELWREKLRMAREVAMKNLDADYMKALELGVDTSEIVTKKQELRDAPNNPKIDAAKTPEELMAVKPDYLDVSPYLHMVMVK